MSSLEPISAALVDASQGSRGRPSYYKSNSYWSVQSQGSVSRSRRKVQFVEKVECFSYPGARDGSTCWYSQDELIDLMDHEIALAELSMQDKEGEYSDMACTRGIEHILSGKNITRKMAKHCKGILQLQALLTLSRQAKADPARVLKQLSQKQSEQAKKRALKLGMHDALCVRKASPSPLRQRLPRTRSGCYDRTRFAAPAC